MLEDAFADAAKNLNSTTLGSVLILVLITFFFTVRALRQDIKEKNEELKTERLDHQKTRDEQKADLRDMARLASAIDEMKDKFVETSLRRDRA